MKSLGCLQGLQLMLESIGDLLCVLFRHENAIGLHGTACAAAVGISMAAAEVSRQQEIVGTQVSIRASSQWQAETAIVLCMSWNMLPLLCCHVDNFVARPSLSTRLPTPIPLAFEGVVSLRQFTPCSLHGSTAIRLYSTNPVKCT